MPQKSEVFSASDSSELRTEQVHLKPYASSRPVCDMVEIGVVFALILVALWTSHGGN